MPTIPSSLVAPHPPDRSRAGGWGARTAFTIYKVREENFGPRRGAFLPNTNTRGPASRTFRPKMSERSSPTPPSVQSHRSFSLAAAVLHATLAVALTAVCDTRHSGACTECVERASRVVALREMCAIKIKHGSTVSFLTSERVHALCSTGRACWTFSLRRRRCCSAPLEAGRRTR